MNAPLRPEVLRLLEESPQTELPLAAEGVLRYVWESRFGKMLIEVKGREVFVNGGRVEPAVPLAEGDAREEAVVQRPGYGDDRA